MSSRPDVEMIDVTDADSFELLPPCADPRFDHRSCDYWEDDVRGAKSARPAWWQVSVPPPAQPEPPPAPGNPFAPTTIDEPDFNPFVPPESSTTPEFNPFAPAPEVDFGDVGHALPRKLRLLHRGHAVFGSYAKVLMLSGAPAAYAQFGPLSAYPRAQRIRELYPRLPQSPLPAVITCVAATSAARGQGLGATLVAAIADDLATRGFSAIEAYPDLTLSPDEASTASPAFWTACGFDLVEDDERYPVMRRDLE